MKMLEMRVLTMLAYFSLVSPAFAHVTLDHPSGSETFVAGEKVTIQWHVTVDHDQLNWDLYFSPDGGANWQELEIDMPTGQVSYQWTVPAVLTQQARIRILMDNTGTDYESTSGDFAIELTPLSISDKNSIPAIIQLKSNYPNPFNPSTTIHFDMPQASEASLIVYDISGRQVAELVNNYMASGSHQVQWDGRDFPSGIYIARLVATGFSKSIKMVLLK